MSELIIDNKNEGLKFDEDKLRFDVIPMEAILGLAEVFTYGAKKYGDFNWEKGVAHHRLYSAVLRHLFAYWGGEDFDPESHISHINHAMANLAILLSCPNKDNRKSI